MDCIYFTYIYFFKEINTQARFLFVHILAYASEDNHNWNKATSTRVQLVYHVTAWIYKGAF